MYLKVPDHSLAGYTYASFADHVLDLSPVFGTRSQLRIGMEARKAIADAVDGVAELPEPVAELWQRACAEAPIPRLVLEKRDAEGNVIGDKQPIGARAYEAFYAAAENMTTERPARIAQVA
jgi:hypothetical protein